MDWNENLSNRELKQLFNSPKFNPAGATDSRNRESNIETCWNLTVENRVGEKYVSSKINQVWSESSFFEETKAKNQF